MRSDDQPTTPLLAILRALEDDARRDEFAAAAGTSRVYLYQLAGCYGERKGCRVQLAVKIAEASQRMAKRYGTPTITVEQLATMCEACAK